MTGAARCVALGCWTRTGGPRHRRACRPWRKTAVAIANTAVHTGLRGDPRTAVREIERTVNDLQATRP